MFIVVKLSNPKTKVKGLIARYLLNLTGNVFVGNVPRFKYQEIEFALLDEDAVVLIQSSSNVQGFEVEEFGSFVGSFREIDGLIFNHEHKIESK